MSQVIRSGLDPLVRAILISSVALLWPLAALSQTLPPATQVAGQFTLGWNLGNTMEAQCSETAWGNPLVNQQLINAVKAAGFNAVRIPAAWDCHADQTTMTIDPTWMARVKQVVDYAYGQGMYVILNIHWDGGWLEEHPLYSHQAAVNQKQRTYWTQIANTFKNYNERMLFAGTNEVHGTLTVGGQARTCGQLPLQRSSDGYYYFSVTAGQFPWASIYAW